VNFQCKVKTNAVPDPYFFPTDLHHFRKPDPDPHQSGKPDPVPNPHQNEKLDEKNPLKMMRIRNHFQNSENMPVNRQNYFKTICSALLLDSVCCSCLSLCAVTLLDFLQKWR
jgi:hypothetical protein